MTMSPAEFASAFSAGLLAFTFALSGAAKLGRSSATLASMMTLRVPVFLQHRWIARALPLGELLLAAVLVLMPGPFRSLAAAATGLTLIAFTLLLAAVLRRGEDADCGCFGPFAASGRITGWSLVRNGVLMLASGLALLHAWSGPSALGAMLAADPVSVLGLGLGWSLLAVLVLVREQFVLRGLLRDSVRAPAAGGPSDAVGSAEPRGASGAGASAGGPDDGWEPPPLSPLSLALGLDPARPGEVRLGEPIPHAELVGANGITQTLAQLGDGRPTLLVFLSTSCGSCHSVAERAHLWHEELDGIAVRIATSSTPREMERMFPKLLPLCRYGSASAISRLGVQRSPAALLLGGQGQPVVASPIAYGLQEIEGLVASIGAAR
ncbi:TlpA family protein disulfide reductase [Brevibacterium album]|uniref:TlpA family protein disulfide reductase n=1 Tax=Brevibacterium album TaxID=417948 RepID=UPI0003FD3341|nr:MauE/DoxX family redox-associated membrane protein [Brevibacterium album]